MTARRIVLTVRPDGTLTAETKNATGSSCMSLLDSIEKLCPGAVVVDSHLTADYHLLDEGLEVDTVQQLEANE